MCFNVHETPGSFSMCDASFTREITHRKGDSLYVPHRGQASQPLMGDCITEGGMRQIGSGFWVNPGSHCLKDIYM